jgi:acetyltransferase
VSAVSVPLPVVLRSSINLNTKLCSSNRCVAQTLTAYHTGALTGSDEVLDAAFRRCGVLRVHNIADLFYMAEVLGKQPRPKGNRLTILTNAGTTNKIESCNGFAKWLSFGGDVIAENDPDEQEKHLMSTCT